MGVDAEKQNNFFVKDELLYHRDKVLQQNVQQICLPTARRNEVCRLAHDMCHLGYKRTKEKLRLNFFWPSMSKTIREYVDTCLACQKKARAVIKDRVPISIVPRDQVPVSHLYMDVIGPLLNKAEYNFCLCLVDSHTRFPFAFPLRSVNAKAMCECLLQVISLVDIASVITSDNATYFTSQLNDKFMELFGCKPRFLTVLHPEGNSLVKRMNASLKKMAHVSQKYPKRWHKLLPIVLWCMRKSRNESLGVSPFMMVMGRNPSNPLKILKDTWTGENQLPQTVGKSISEFLAELQAQIQEIHDY